MYDVVIDVIGGASAGGITSMMTILEMMKGHKPVHEPSKSKTGNIFYDTWVLLNDNPNDDNAKKVMDKMLDISDIKGNKNGIPSLLNSGFIDEIADNVFEKNLELFDVNNLPNFMSKDIYLLVTLCSVRGIPFEIEFDVRDYSLIDDIPAHRMNEHMIIARFKMKYNDTDIDHAFPFDLNNENNRNLLKLCAKGTSAFPVGLAPRQFKNLLSKEYVRNNIISNMGEIEKEKLKVVLDDEMFNFTCVDGGTINNEPYTQVLRELKIKGGDYNKEHPNYGIIMIDPFPNFYDQTQIQEIENDLSLTEKKRKKEKKNKSIFQFNMFDFIASAYPMFQEQTRIKREPEFFGDEFKMLVYPAKKKSKSGNNKPPFIPRPHPPIASAVLGGFGGFLNKKFRDHDYFLGRDNARNFLRGVFMFKYDKNNLHPLFNDLDDDAYQTFRIKPRGNNPQGHFLFPVIPDFKNPKYTDNGCSYPFSYTVEEYPKLERKDIEAYSSKLKTRVKLIIKIKSKEWLKNNWLLRNAIGLFKGKIAGSITNKLIDKIVGELDNHRLLK